MAGTTYLKLFYDLEDTAVKMSDADAGQLLKALLHYGRTGEDISPESPIADIVYGMVKSQVDRDQESYNFGAKGGRPQKKNGGFENENPPSGKGKPPFHKDKDKDKDKGEDEDEDTSSTTGGDTGADVREETPFGPVTVDPLIVKVQRELLGLTDTHYDLLAQYREEIGDEMVSYAIDQAVANGARKWAYVESVLLRLKSAGIRTVAEAKAADEKRKTGSRDAPKAPKQVHAQQFTQRSYTDEQLEGGVDPLLAEAMAKVRAEKARSTA